MTEQIVEERYRTVAELAAYLGVGIHVVYRNVKAGRWKVSRTSDSPRAPIRVSPAQAAAIEEDMARNGNRAGLSAPAPQRDTRDAVITNGMRRLSRAKR